VLDTGLDMDHPEFRGRVVPGYDFVNNDADPSDDQGHGTHAAASRAGVEPGRDAVRDDLATQAVTLDRGPVALAQRFREVEHQVFGEDGFEHAVAQIDAVEKSLGIENLAQFTPVA